MKQLYLPLLILLPGIHSMAQSMVQNIKSSPDIHGQGIRNGFAYNNVVYFVGNDLTNGAELWRTDGTPDGTYLLRDINPGKNDSEPAAFTVYNGEVYFSADDGFRGREVWKTDGTSAGTVLVADVRTGRSPAEPREFTVFNGLLYFTALNGPALLGTAEGYDRRLYRTNGTEAGTAEITNLYTSSDDRIENLLVFDSRLYFTGTNGTQRGLWQMEADHTMTFRLAGTIGLLTLSNQALYFRHGSSSTANILYRLQDSLTQVKTFENASGFSLVHLTNVSGTLFFSANANAANSDNELWKSDGTTAGTVMVKDLRPGTQSSQPRDFRAMGGSLYFIANDGTTGTELWRSDGSAAGTVLVTDLPGNGFSATAEIIVAAPGKLYFTSIGELWRSDGTPAGTAQVFDFYPGSQSSSASGLVALNGKVVLSAANAIIGKEVYISDGTGDGTLLLKNIVPDEASSFGETPETDLDNPWYAQSNGQLFFAASDNTRGTELWKTSGNGSTLVAEIVAGTDGGFPRNLINTGGDIHFSGNGAVAGRELWSSDGETGVTAMLSDIRPAGSSSFPQQTVSVGGLTFFTANDGTHGVELWRSDGTANGTFLVKDILPGSGTSGVMHLTVFRNKLYFLANDGVNGMELWTSDGTGAGTFLVKDLRPGANGAFSISSAANELLAYGGSLYFKAEATSSAMDLWKTDGVDLFTRLTNHDATPKYLAAANGKVFFNGRGPGVILQEELYVVDTLEINAVRLTQCCAFSETARPSQIVAYNNRVYFNMHSDATGWELGWSDGISVGLLDLLPGKESSNPMHLTVLLDKLYFAAATREQGVELWKSDGTLAGSQPVSDIWNGAQSSNPQYFVAANQVLYFIANNGTNNYELFSYSPHVSYSLPMTDAAGSTLINWHNHFITRTNPQLIATVYQTGAQPLNDSITASVRLDAGVQRYNGRPYVQRHYDIEPALNGETATATVVLYFTQEEFNRYNATNDGYADLPGSTQDIAAKAAIRILQFHGKGSAPGNYPGTMVEIDPDDSMITWNNAGYWEIAFPVNGFSGFYLTTVSADLLPVSLVDFRGYRKDTRVLLEWKTTDEQQLTGYEVQRQDGAKFVKLVYQKAKNENAASYQYFDAQPGTGMNYYRLKMLEADGSSTYSKVIGILFTRPGLTKLYPVPAQHQITISSTDAALTGTPVIVYNQAGRQVFAFTLKASAHKLSLAAFAPGVYYLRFTDGTLLRFQKL